MKNQSTKKYAQMVALCDYTKVSKEIGKDMLEKTIYTKYRKVSKIEFVLFPRRYGCFGKSGGMKATFYGVKK